MFTNTANYCDCMIALKVLVVVAKVGGVFRVCNGMEVVPLILVDIDGDIALNCRVAASGWCITTQSSSTSSTT